MNLVAKEYVAAQDPEDPGVLILSRFAGAALQLKQALLVNPYSAEEVSDAILRALEMPLEERKQRWRAMVDNIAEQDVGWWRARFVALLDPEEVATNPRREVALEAKSSEEHTSELQSLMRISYAVFCLKNRIDGE